MNMRFLRLCSIALILALLINLLPAQAIALDLDEIKMADTSGETLSEENVSDESAASPAKIIAEIPEKRTAFTKDYQLSNGFHMSVVYPEVVHYEDNGQWKEIDNTLKLSGKGNNRVYTNAAGGWNVIFPQQMRNDNRVSVVKDGYTVSFGMAGELRSAAELMSEADQSSRALSAVNTNETTVMQMQAATAQIAQKASVSEQAKLEHPEIVREKLYSRLTYENVYNNVDVVYDLNGYQLKESIVISSYDATVRGYQYVLETGTLTPVLNDDGSIDLFAQTGREAVMRMPAPYMIDSAGNVSYDVEVSLAPNNGSYLLTYHMPSSWLADPDRAWPVVLDPVILAESHWNNILDQFVAEHYTSSYTAGSLFCGYHHDLGKMRTFIQYVNLPTLTSADVIVHAELSLQYLAGGSENTSVIEAHKVNATWDSQTITWQNQPSHSAIVEDYAIVSADQRYSWGITDLVRDWYASENTGVMLKMPNNVESGTVTNWKKFYSVDYSMYSPQLWPKLNIVYRNTNGLEGYWDYTASSAGRAGTGYIHNYSGNLVWVRDDIGFGGNRMPVTISHIYNANDSAVDTFGMGYGWRTNFNQLVYQWTEDSNYYIWEDGDGTKHYFLFSEYNEGKAKYLDEDGLELELTVTGSGTSATYCITDKNGNTSHFDSYGRLCRMTNNQETSSSITITYSSVDGKYILNITDGVGRRYGFSYGGVTLRKITYYGTGGTALSYVDFIQEGGQLKRITDKDGKSCYYTYGANNLLTSAQDVDGYKLTYTYNTMATGQPARIKTVAETDGTASGGTLSIEYAKNQTTFTDYNGNVQVMQFNNWGNTVSIQDDQGRAQFAQYALNDVTSTASSTAKGNQLTMSSKLQNTVGNIQRDNSFENGVAWISLNSDRVIGYVTTAEAYMGNKSLAMVRETSGALSGLYGPWFTIPAGETYTFSAYVKTGTGSACLIISNGTTVIYSDYLAANSDWTRMEVSYTNNTSEDTSVTARVQTAQAGTVYMDCVQIERAPTASRYNLIDNGDFRNTYSWSSTSGITTPSNLEAAAPELNNTVYSMTGSPTAANGVTQTVLVSGSAGDSYVLSGWAKGDSVPLGEFNGVNREFGMKLTFNNTDGTTDTQSVSFNCDLPSDGNWQYAATPAVAKKAYSSITVELVYNYNANTVYFDGIQLYKEAFGNSYTYDADGNITSVKDLQSQTTTYEYTNNNLTKEILPSGAVMTYTYDDHHNVKTATTAEGLVYSFTYDTYGNNTSVSINYGTKKITSSATYTADGNRLVSTTDDLENVTTYCYNENTNVLEWVQYPNDTASSRTTYTYDSMYRLASSASAVSGLSSGTALTASYTYTDDLLTAIQTGSTTYSFSYGDFAQRSRIQIGSRMLARYEYTPDQNRYLDKLIYGNDDYVAYDYDSQGRVILETFEDGSTVSYQYDNTGALATMTDSATGRKTTYYYDLTDRLMKYVETGSGYKHSAEYGYDNLNNLSWLTETINGVKHTTNYTYDEDNRLTGTTYVDLANGEDVSETIVYDDYGRIRTINVKNNGAGGVSSWFQYANSNIARYETTRPVYMYTFGASGDTLYSNYKYDANGNITSYLMYGENQIVWDNIYESPTIMGESTYHYDTANQLVREDNRWLGKTFVWTYDDAGNITSCKEYAYTSNQNPVSGTPIKTNTYTYGDSSWGDLLTAYNGTQWSYDGAGNLTNDGTWTYTWRNGRELASMTNGSTTWSYTYDANGMRTSRSNGSTTYTYVYNGSQLTQMTKGSDTLYFTYGISGPTTVTWNGTTYYYALNAQGDVIGIFDGGGNGVVLYNWDNAWGYHPQPEGPMADTLGTLNPLRYRSYVYDEETGLYYLQSRYYNPEIGRFINADDVDYLGAGPNPTSYNLFAYCGNNPVMGYDPTGHWNWGWKEQAGLGTTVLIVGLALLLAVPTGGSSLAFGALALSSTAVVAAGSTMAIVGTVMVGDAMAARVNQSKSNGNKSGKDYQQANGNKQANEWAKKVGYKNAEELKKDYVGNDGSKFNMYRNRATGEILLIGIKGFLKGVEQTTGLFLK